MRIQPSLGSVVGITDEVHWGQVFLSPSAYGIVEIDDPEAHARDWGIKVLSRLSEQTTDPPRSLKAARDIAIKAMEETVVSLILLVPVGAIVYIVVLGQGKVLLKRGDNLATLMDEPGAISGAVQEGDTLLLISRSVTEVLTHEEINMLFDHLEAPTVAENMTLAIHKHEGGSGGAALIFQVKGLTPVEAEELPPRVRQSIGRVHIKERLRNMPIAWRRPTVIVSTMLIFVFIISVVLGIRKQMGQKVHTEVARILTTAEHAFDEGVALLELNPVKGRERFTVARDALAPLRESLSPSSAEGKAVAKLYKDVTDQLAIAMQINRVDPALFYDFSLLKAQATIFSLGQNSDSVALLDSHGPTVATLTIPAKNGRIVAGGESFRGATLLAMHGDIMFVLVEGGIHRISQDGKTTSLIVKKDDQWGNIASFISYGGNLYLLDTGKSRIWKYIATDVGFSETREYLNPDTLPDLSLATGMAVDGGIWAGTRNGKILHFVGGKEESFVPRGIEPAFGKTLVVATTEEDKNLYVLDSDNKRVVVLDKAGVYLAQYVWAGALTPAQIVVSEKLKLILLLADGKLYSVELK